MQSEVNQKQNLLLGFRMVVYHVGEQDMIILVS